MNDEEKKQVKAALRSAYALNFCNGYLQALEEVIKIKEEVKKCGLADKDILHSINIGIKEMIAEAKERFSKIKNQFPDLYLTTVIYNDDQIEN